MKKLNPSAWLPVVVLLTVTVWAGCDSASGPDVPTASLFGVVREADSLTPIPDVSVMLGAARTTTDQDGRYVFRDVPAGSTSLTIRVTAVRFDAYTRELILQEGANTHDIALVRKTYYESAPLNGRFGLYLTPGVTTYRGVIFFVAPQSIYSDSRGFASGQPTTSEASVNAYRAAVRARLLRVAEDYGLALMGAQLSDRTPASLNSVLAALAHFAEATGRPELAQAPLLLNGVQEGACFAYDLTSAHSDRVIGFLMHEGGICPVVGDAPAARPVPGYLFFGELDTAERRGNITRLFEGNRPGGALWALAVEPGAGAGPVRDLDLIAHWMDAVLEARLPAAPPPGSPVTLNALNETSGWLGNRQTFEIAAYAEYGGNPQQASWLPTMQTAQDWRAFVSR